VADIKGFWKIIGDERGQQRAKIVTAAFLEFVEQGWSPVFHVGFQAVAEDGIRCVGAAGFHFFFRDFADELCGDGCVFVIDDESFGAPGPGVLLSCQCGWKYRRKLLNDWRAHRQQMLPCRL